MILSKKQIQSKMKDIKNLLEYCICCKFTKGIVINDNQCIFAVAPSPNLRKNFYISVYLDTNVVALEHIEGEYSITYIVTKSLADFDYNIMLAIASLISSEESVKFFEEAFENFSLVNNCSEGMIKK